MIIFRTGGASNITMEKLESSIAHIKDMFKERANIIQNMTSTNAPAENEKEHWTELTEGQPPKYKAAFNPSKSHSNILLTKKG